MNAKNRRTHFLHFSYFFFYTKYHENRNLWKLECSIKNRLLFILFRTYRVSRKIEIVRRATHFIIELMMRFKSQFWYILDDSLWLCCMKRMIYKRKKIYEKKKKNVEMKNENEKNANSKNCLRQTKVNKQFIFRNFFLT
jgi:predicted membrane protein